MFLTPSERNSIDRDDRPCPGIMVRIASGERYFWPGATAELGMIMARNALGDKLDAAETRIEFGRAQGTSWVCEKVIKSPVLHHDRLDRP